MNYIGCSQTNSEKNVSMNSIHPLPSDFVSFSLFSLNYKKKKIEIKKDATK